MLKNTWEKTLYFTLLSKEEFLSPLVKQESSFQVTESFGVIACLIAANSLDNLFHAEEYIRSFWGSYEFFTENGSIASALQDFMVHQKLTLVLAESCTGGYLSHKITLESGASDYFLGSFVTYSNALKKQILRVQESSLEKHGAVSEEVVKEMLQGVLSLSRADIGIAVSGIAGPLGGSLEKPVGTVFAAFGSKNNYASGFFHIRGPREEVIILTASRLLGMLYRKLRYQAISPGFNNFIL